jgi:hypothetical protein
MTVLTTWPLLLALATLIVNDAWLKSAYPGLISGKLSDIAGIAVVALLGMSGFDYTFPHARTISFQVQAPPDSMFGGGNSKKLERLRYDLKVHLRGFPVALEFVQPIDARQFPP